MASNRPQGDSDNTLRESQDLLDQLQGLLETLSNVSSKNETLLEALETAEMKAAQAGSSEVMSTTVLMYQKPLQ